MTAPTLPPSQVEALREKAETYQRASIAFVSYSGRFGSPEYFRLCVKGCGKVISAPCGISLDKS